MKREKKAISHGLMALDERKNKEENNLSHAEGKKKAMGKHTHENTDRYSSPARKPHQKVTRWLNPRKHPFLMFSGARRNAEAGGGILSGTHLYYGESDREERTLEPSFCKNKK